MGRRKKGEDDAAIKKRFLERIGELFFSRGMTSSTMDEVSKSFRVSKKTLYRFFPTKDEMILQAAQLFGSRIAAFAEKKFRRIERLGPEAFAPQMKEFFGKLGSLLLSIHPSFFYEMEKTDKLLFDKIDAVRQSVIRRILGKALTTGILIGKVRNDIDPDLVAHILAGMIRQIVSREGIGPDKAPYEVFAAVVRILFEGILLPEGKAEFIATAFPKSETTNVWEDLREASEDDPAEP